MKKLMLLTGVCFLTIGFSPINSNPMANRLVKQLVADVPHNEKAFSELIAMGRTAVPALINGMASYDEMIRTQCMRALVRIGTPAERPLMDALKNRPEWRVRAWSALALGEMKSNVAVDTLIDSLRYDNHWWVQCESALALGKIGNERAIPVLETISQDGDERVNYRARFALEKLRE
ncbi:MAG TPA: HEAT repeat domain-containing protein [Fimbriimonadales bacterium]|nr:HEAT repeat domain-containing protein [Fimbriimonadales bacterium]